MERRCEAIYTRQRWRLDHGGELRHESLFDADGEWRCPRASPDGADRCCFHQDPDRRPPDAELARRLLAELRGDRELARGHEPGELVGVELGDLLLATDAVGDGGDTDGSGDDRTGESDRSLRQLTVVGATIDRLRFGDALPTCDVAIDGLAVADLSVEGATLGELSLSSVAVDGSVTVDGEATRIDTLRLGTAVRTERAVSIGSDAVVRDQLVVDGARIDVPSLVIDSGARVGLDAPEDTTAPGVRFEDVAAVDTDLLVRGGETTLGTVTLVGSRLESVYVQQCPGVRNAIELRDSTLEGNLQVEDTTSRPAMTLTGAAVDVITVRNSAQETVTVDEGTTTTALNVEGTETSVPGGIEVSGASTTVDTLRVADDATVGTGVWVHDGALVRDRLRIDESKVAALAQTPEQPALRVTDRGTRVGAISLSGADVAGVAIERATVPEELHVATTELSLPEASARSDGDGGDSRTSTAAVVRVVDATVGDITVSDGETNGAVSVARASVRQLTVEGDATVGGPVEVRDETTVEKSITIEGSPDFSAPLCVTDGVTVGGDLSLSATSGQATFDCETGIALDGARIDGDLQVGMDLSADEDVIRIDGTSVEGTLGTETASLDGNLVVCGGSVIGRDIALSSETTVETVSLTDAATVRGSLSLTAASVDELAVRDARINRRVELVEGTTVSGPITFERDATVGGDLVVGDASGDGETTRVDGTVSLGNRADAHPMSGGVTIQGSVALTGAATVEAGIELSDVVVGEDLHVVGERSTATVGQLDLFDCIVRGKVHVDGASLQALSLQECRIGESVWIGSVDTGRTDAIAAAGDAEHDAGASQDGTPVDLETTVKESLTIAATPVAENVVLRGARVGELELTDTSVTGRVDLDAAVVEGTVDIAESTIGERARIGAGRVRALSVSRSAIGRALEIGPDWRVEDDAVSVPSDSVTTSELTIDGALTVTETTVDADLTLDCRIETGRDGPWPRIEGTEVTGAVRLRPRFDAAGHVSLRNTTLPGGTLVVTTPDGAADRCWYDLRRATLGDVSVEIADGEGVAVEHLLLLETRYDGFRFGDLPGGVTNGRIHGLGSRQATDDVPGIPTVDDRVGANRTMRYRLGEAYARLPFAGTGYRDGDPPPAALEQTYLNAKNGASQVGDEDVAGVFFTLEKRYRRRRLWETVAGVGGSTSVRRVGATGVDWLGNAIFDRMAVYGESPGRVVTVSTSVIAVFSVFFALLLDRPPYGDQYLGSGILPDWVALALQPLTLSIESFVTLVLVGPASQRLTPLVHLLGQIEGFLGVFLVALFVFTLTRSVHR